MGTCYRKPDMDVKMKEKGGRLETTRLSKGSTLQITVEIRAGL